MTGTDAIEADDGVTPAAAYCHLAAPILWSSRDTAETIAAVKAHNAGYDRLCRSD